MRRIGGLVRMSLTNKVDLFLCELHVILRRGGRGTSLTKKVIKFHGTYRLVVE
jgi:hypothetical protein